MESEKAIYHEVRISFLPRNGGGLKVQKLTLLTPLQQFVVILFQLSGISGKEKVTSIMSCAM